jgi:hypothetical protein
VFALATLDPTASVGLCLTSSTQEEADQEKDMAGKDKSQLLSLTDHVSMFVLYVLKIHPDCLAE